MSTLLILHLPRKLFHHQTMALEIFLGLPLEIFD
jgi:hypothetical protein